MGGPPGGFMGMGGGGGMGSGGMGSKYTAAIIISVFRYPRAKMSRQPLPKKLRQRHKNHNV